MWLRDLYVENRNERGMCKECCANGRSRVFGRFETGEMCFICVLFVCSLARSGRFFFVLKEGWRKQRRQETVVVRNTRGALVCHFHFDVLRFLIYLYKSKEVVFRDKKNVYREDYSKNPTNHEIVCFKCSLIFVLRWFVRSDFRFMLRKLILHQIMWLFCGKASEKNRTTNTYHAILVICKTDTLSAVAALWTSWAPF